jgi:hypothetical protein
MVEQTFLAESVWAPAWMKAMEQPLGSSADLDGDQRAINSITYLRRAGGQSRIRDHAKKMLARFAKV